MSYSRHSETTTRSATRRALAITGAPSAAAGRPTSSPRAASVPKASSPPPPPALQQPAEPVEVLPASTDPPVIVGVPDVPDPAAMVHPDGLRPRVVPGAGVGTQVVGELDVRGRVRASAAVAPLMQHPRDLAEGRVAHPRRVSVRVGDPSNPEPVVLDRRDESPEGR